MNKGGLTGRLTIIIILAAIISSAASGFAMLYISKKQFVSYLDSSGRMLAQRYVLDIERYYQKNGSLQGLQPFIEEDRSPGGNFGHGPRFRSAQMGRRVIVADNTGLIAADSSGLLYREKISEYEKDLLVFPLFAGDKKKIGTLYISSPLKPGISTLESDFINSISKSISISVLIVAFLAFLLGLILSRSITRPMADLSSAIHEVARGNLKARVNPSGDRELASLAQDFNIMARKLMEHEESRVRLVSNIAHELRTPLSIIRGQLEAIQSGKQKINEEISSSLVDEVIRLTRLVKDLETIGLADSGVLKLNIEDIKIEDIADRMLPLRLVMEEDSIDFNIEIESGIEIVKADFNRLTQVLINLLSNAIRHAGKGGKITLKINSNDNMLVFAVEDNGPGINEKDLSYVFERFYRVDENRNRQTGGTGLGLAIARSYVEAHKGIIWVESQVEKGTTFYFSIPRA